MNKLLLWACLFLPTLGFSQSFHHAFSTGFHTQQYNLIPLHGGERWLSVSVSKPYPGAFYRDSIYAMVINSDGAVLNQILLPNLISDSEETHSVSSVCATPDGGFVISISGDLCDAGLNYGTLVAYDVLGNLKWMHRVPGLTGTLHLSPGNQIALIAKNETMIIFDPANGNELFRAKLVSSSLLYLQINDFAFIPDSTQLLTVGSPSIQKWQLVTTGGQPEYHLLDHESIPNLTSLSKLLVVGNQWFSFNTNSGRFFEINPDNVPSYQLKVEFPAKIRDVVVLPEGFAFLVAPGSNGLKSVIRTNGMGVIQDTISAINPIFEARSLAYQNGFLGIAGLHYTGDSTINSLEAKNYAKNLWLHTRRLDNPILSPHATVALSQVWQTAPILVDSSSFLMGPRYSYSGGNFKMEITNTGTTLLKSFNLQIGFNWIEDICFTKPVKTVHYTGLNIEPQASMVVDFGGIDAPLQNNPPASFCFWTSCPNEQPDFQPSDDVYCLQVFTPAKEPEFSVLSVFPNPTNHTLTVKSEYGFSGESWKLFDVAGQLVKSEILPDNTFSFDINTSNLHPGFYVLKLGEVIKPVMVKR